MGKLGTEPPERRRGLDSQKGAVSKG